MNNAEKFAEVFGYDLPIRVFCSNDYCPECHKYCLDVFQCSGWAEAEYQEKRAQNECEAEDCISRENLQITLFEKCNGNPNYRINFHNLKSLINKMPSVYLKSDKSVLEDIKAEIQKKKLLYTHPHEMAKNVYREAMNDVIECIDNHISGKEQQGE